MAIACCKDLSRRAVLCIVAACVFAAGGAAQPSEIAKRRAAERKTFSDAEIVDGFFKIVFGAEFHSSGPVDRIRKFTEPVRVHVHLDRRARGFLDGRRWPDRPAQVAAAVTDIRLRVRHLDIATVENPAAANVVVSLVRERDLARTIRSVYGRDQARRISRALRPQCLSGFARADDFRIVRASVILVADAGEPVFLDCLYEELLQALGPINDDSSVPWSMFNDDVELGFFGIYDQYLLNILYHPRIRPGMSRAEVAAVMPQVLPEVRAFVAQTNGLPN